MLALASSKGAPRRALALFPVVAVFLTLSACVAPTDAPREGPVALAPPPPTTHERPSLPLPVLQEAPRGLGSMTARVPGTSETVGGVHLAAHHARVTIAHGVAHTEIEEEFRNDASRALEGRLVFPLPEGSTLGRLALWVGTTLVEGEVLERSRADRIFRGIVDDTVRPRDPAILDVVSGGRLSLRIFPIPAKGSRKVVLAYDQVLHAEGGKLRYVHPLSLGSDRATPIDDLSIEVDGVTKLAARNVVPTRDVVVTLDEAPPALAMGSATHAKSGTEWAVLAREVARAEDGARPFEGDVVIALDASEAQSGASLAAQIHMADAVLSRLGATESFAILACDTACAAFPKDGRALPTPDALDDARRFLASLEPAGPSDPAGALEDAVRRLDASRSGQIVLFSDGAATAGELSPATQIAHVAPLLAGTDVRVIGVGRTVDDRSLSALARGLGATYDRLASDASLAERVVALAESRRTPVVKSPHVALPIGAFDPEPATPMPTRAGEETIVLARALVPLEGALPTTAPLPRLWARERIAGLEARGDEANAELTALSIRHHVLARTTALLVLENDRMFAEFGIPRTTEAAAGASGTPAGDALGLGEGFGSGAGRLSGEHRTRAPSVRMGATMVSGRLPPEVVQRIVRQNFGRFRLCFEKGLLRNPSLGGRVATKFVIDRAGGVASVADAGSDLPDQEVVACVVRSFANLSFPEPEGGIVTVVYPIVFAGDSGGGAAPTPPVALAPRPIRGHGSVDVDRFPANSALAPKPWEPPPEEQPSASHREGDDRWLSAPAPRLDAMAARVERDPARRRGHLELIHARLAAGRMEDAYTAARAFVSLDPDLPAAREALAEAAAATGRRDTAVRAMAAASALAPRSPSRQLAAARSAFAVGDARRACAHLRALGDLEPKSHAARAQTCRDAGAASLPDAPREGFEASVSCEGAACPTLAIVTPLGRVVSPWTAGSNGGGAATAPLMSGAYRTLVTGPGAGGKLEVRALGASYSAKVSAEDAKKTAVVSFVSIPAPRWGWRQPRVRF